MRIAHERERDDVGDLPRDVREIGRTAQLEKRVLLAEGAVFGHVAPGLTHEPDWCGVNRLAPAGFQETGGGHS